jgi:hypothetical protein
MKKKLMIYLLSFCNLVKAGQTISYLTHDQQRVLTLYNALAVKHDSAVLKELSASITKFAETNRKTGIRFTRMIESYSLYKHFKGFQMSGNVGDEKK